MAKKCKTCGKPLPNPQLDYCSQECIEKAKAKQNSQKTQPNNTPENEIQKTLKDAHYMRGLSWRQAKLEAIHKARQEGYSDEWIMLQLMRGGLTRLTAKN